MDSKGTYCSERRRRRWRRYRGTSPIRNRRRSRRPGWREGEDFRDGHGEEAHHAPSREVVSYGRGTTVVAPCGEKLGRCPSSIFPAIKAHRLLAIARRRGPGRPGGAGATRGSKGTYCGGVHEARRCGAAADGAGVGAGWDGGELCGRENFEGGAAGSVGVAARSPARRARI